MSKTLRYLEYGTLTIVAGGNTSAGDVVSIAGHMIGIAKVSVLSGAELPLFVDGVHKVPRATGGSTAWTQGAPIFYDTGNSVFTKTAGANTIYAGLAHRATADGDAYGEIILNRRGRAATIAALTGGEPPTEAEFNGLVTALKNAGYIAFA